MNTLTDLKAFMAKHDKTVTDVAASTGLSVSTVKRLLKAEQPINRSTKKLVQDFLEKQTKKV